MFRRGKILFFILLAFAGVFNIPHVGFAETAEELQAKIDSQNQALASIESEIASYKQQLQVIGSNKNTLSNAIKKLTLESSKLKADISLSQSKITVTNLKIEALSDTIVKTNKVADDLAAALAKDLREMNAADNDSLRTILISTRDFSSLWHYIGQQNAFNKGIYQKATQLATTRDALIASKSQVEAAKKNLLAIDSELQDQKKINQQTAAQKAQLLKSTKSQETTYQKLVAQKSAARDQMAADLRDYESKLKYILDPSSLPPPGSSPLAWPTEKFVITQLFGKTVSAKRLYTNGSHNGIDFGLSTGTPVKALASGTVIGSGNSDLSCPGASYGKWILIKYDNGLASVFGHLSLVKASTGAHVDVGDTVAYSGASGYATGPHLHVSVFANTGVSINSFPSKSCSGRTITIPTAAANAYLDPMLYFPPKPK